MLTHDVFKGFIIPNNSLLAMAEPLIAQVARVVHKNTPTLPLQELSFKYTESFIENSTVAIGLLDKQFQFVSVSPKFFTKLQKWFLNSKRLKSKTKDYIIGKSFFDVIVPCPDYIKKTVRSALRGKYHRGVIPLMLPNKTVKWVRWEIFPWHNFENRPIGAMFFCEDITKEHNALIMNKKLTQCNQMLQDFSLIFFHDLIQPLRQIANFFHLLKIQLDEVRKKDSFTEIALRSIDQSMHQIQSLSEGMVMYCKDGDMTAQAEPVSLFAVITQVRNSCLNYKDFNFRSLIENDVKLFMNPICLTQLLQNLIVNAIKHSPDKNTLVSLSGNLGKKSGFYDFVLHNDGVCTIEKPRKSVFDPFKSSRVDGAGLGLMICKKIVRAYKGKISFYSSPEEGTKVFFSLPMFLLNENSVK